MKPRLRATFEGDMQHSIRKATFRRDAHIPYTLKIILWTSETLQLVAGYLRPEPPRM